MSEEDIKRLFITPAIESKWDAYTQRMEKYFTDGRVIVCGLPSGQKIKKQIICCLSSRIFLWRS